jgi:hypothetical protein
MIEDEEVATPDENDLADVRSRIVDAILNGSAACRKALLQELVVEVRVTDRQAIQPVFRIPRAGVREVSRLVTPAGFEPAISALRGLRPSPLDDGAIRYVFLAWWAVEVLNLRPLACEASALPLS